MDVIPICTHTRSNHLLSGPHLLRFEDGGRQQLDAPLLVSETSVDQLSVLSSSEETASQRHSGSRHHVILNQPCQRFTILLEEEIGHHQKNDLS